MYKIRMYRFRSRRAKSLGCNFKGKSFQKSPKGELMSDDLTKAIEKIVFFKKIVSYNKNYSVLHMH